MRERLSSIFRLALSSMVTSIALTLGVSAPARADVVYTYTGNGYRDVGEPYKTTDFVTVTMTLPSALGPNLSSTNLVPDLVSLSMSDGVQTLSLGVPGELADATVSTDASGNINSWLFALTNPTAYPVSSIFTYCCGEDTQDYAELNPGYGANYSDPGTWLISGPPSAVPLPAALPLFATGLVGLGLLGWRRKRKAA